MSTSLKVDGWYWKQEDAQTAATHWKGSESPQGELPVVGRRHHGGRRVCILLTLTEEASRRETVRVMRDLGFNLRVIPAATEMGRFYLTGFSDRTMPEESLAALASARNLSYNHLVGVLHGKVTVEGRDVLVMGISPEEAPPGKKKPPMVHAVEPGTIQVGAEIAHDLHLKKGDRLEVGGRSFRVARCMPEMGSADDMRIVGSLPDMQAVLGLEGKINEIKAIDCLCMQPTENPQGILQAEIERTLPGTRVVMLSSIAEARGGSER